MSPSRIRGRYDVDRDLPELLQELRVAQTGGQLFFAFLFSVAFTPAFESLSDAQRLLYGWDLFVVASATTVLVAPVAVHQWNFGRGLRPQLLVVTHVLTAVGLILLAIGLLLGITLVATVVFPDAPFWLPSASAVLLLSAWVALPVATQWSGRQWPVGDRSYEEHAPAQTKDQ